MQALLIKFTQFAYEYHESYLELLITFRNLIGEPLAELLVPNRADDTIVDRSLSIC